MKTTTCVRCGAEIQFEPLLFNGREVGSPRYCDRCGNQLAKMEASLEAESLHRDRIERSGLPPNLRGLPLADNSLGVVAGRWARGELGRPGLCLTGEVGVGKTYLGAAACWERLRTKTCSWTPVSRLLTRLRGGFGDERDSAVQALLSTGAMVLDDLDKVNPTEYGREVIFSAVDGRVEVNAPILVTTNLSLDRIGEKLGDAVASRLAGHCEVIQMTGEDRRLG